MLGFITQTILPTPVFCWFLLGRPLPGIPVVPLTLRLETLKL